MIKEIASLAGKMSAMGQKAKLAPARPWSAPTLKPDFVARASIVG
jgi:hypothetical protein